MSFTELWELYGVLYKTAELALYPSPLSYTHTPHIRRTGSVPLCIQPCKEGSLHTDRKWSWELYKGEYPVFGFGSACPTHLASSSNSFSLYGQIPGGRAGWRGVSVFPHWLPSSFGFRTLGRLMQNFPVSWSTEDSSELLTSPWAGKRSHWNSHINTLPSCVSALPFLVYCLWSHRGWIPAPAPPNLTFLLPFTHIYYNSIHDLSLWGLKPQ